MPRERSKTKRRPRRRHEPAQLARAGGGIASQLEEVCGAGIEVLEHLSRAARALGVLAGAVDRLSVQGRAARATEGSDA